ncbi:hypothetical protein ACFTWF_20800 [Rhodococcus sp. NPDC056960]|uniref:hypothetical protein n=1 Tax=Rhodococcus sp. NPDC056960 TaxID=3345982 RepID=UPI00364029E7
MGGADRILVLSNGSAARLKCELPHKSGNIIVMHWGPQLNSPIYIDTRTEAVYDFVSAGKTNRNYSWLRERAIAERANGLIIRDEAVERFADGQHTLAPNLLDYEETVNYMKSSRVIVIPLDDPERLSGLTEAADAIGLSKPMLVSNSVLFPFDVEESKGGAWLDVGIPLMENIKKAESNMSNKGSGLAKLYTIDVYAEELLNIFRECVDVQ